ncbi:MAG TPA: hypothetical protein DIU14_07890, partial [Actinobacteria bacterium]|nr:hypothetical protein [Actinomycetota bacterium]
MVRVDLLDRAVLIDPRPHRARFDDQHVHGLAGGDARDHPVRGRIDPFDHARLVMADPDGAERERQGVGLVLHRHGGGDG